MIRVQLEQFNKQELVDIGERSGITIDPDMIKESMIEIILDRFDEDEESFANYAERIESNKFSVIESKEIGIFKEESFQFPKRYNETIVSLLLRDSSWGFIFWDIQDEQRSTLEATDGFKEFFIRVYHILETGSEKMETKSFDLPIEVDDLKYYVEFPHQDCRYFATIGCIINEKEEILAQSGKVYVSDETVKSNNDSFGHETDLLIRMSGVLQGSGHFLDNLRDRYDPQKIIHWEI